jgi:hypothetical protein
VPRSLELLSIHLMTYINKPSTKFVYADGVTLEQLEHEFAKAEGKGLSEAERLSLVKRSKSTTDTVAPYSRLQDLTIYEPIREIDDLRPEPEPETPRSGQFTMIQQRRWSGEYRIRTRVESSLSKPPIHSGPRISKKLSNSAARKIRDSCYFMAHTRGGYKTFVTGTFTEDIREKIHNGDTSIQREVTRTMDGLQKMYRRGWTTSKGQRVQGFSCPLAYCWVVEVPLNKKYVQNPHVHILMNWEVPKNLFSEWAKRLEGLWGKGYFHLEKIHEPMCAGAYIAKAANYLTKASRKEDQGIVKGNRYGISRSARAPTWETVKEAELGIMGKLITDLYETNLEDNEHLYLKRNQLREALFSSPLGNKKLKRQIKAKLNNVNEQIRSLPVVASKYQLIFKTSDSFWEFIGSAMGAGWSANKRPDSLWMKKFSDRMALLKKDKLLSKMSWTDAQWTYSMSDYQRYDNEEDKGRNIEDWEHYERTSDFLDLD